jgi:hypothetical protein
MPLVTVPDDEGTALPAVMQSSFAAWERSEVSSRLLPSEDVLNWPRSLLVRAHACFET